MVRISKNIAYSMPNYNYLLISMDLTVGHYWGGGGAKMFPIRDSTKYYFMFLDNHHVLICPKVKLLVKYFYILINGIEELAE